MTKIFFFSPTGYDVMKDDAIRALCNTHGWQSPGDTWVYGVAIPKLNNDPCAVADYLTSKGVIVIPGVHDHTSPVDGRVVSALAKHGITPGDKGIDVAQKMAKASGNPALRPHLF